MHAVVQQSLFVSWIIRWCQDILSISIVVNPLRVLSVLCCFDDLLTSQRGIRRTDVGVCTCTLPQTSTTHTKLHPVLLVHTHTFYLQSLQIEEQVRFTFIWGWCCWCSQFLSVTLSHTLVHSLTLLHTHIHRVWSIRWLAWMMIYHSYRYWIKVLSHESLRCFCLFIGRVGSNNTWPLQQRY